MKTYEIETSDGRKVQFDWDGQKPPTDKDFMDAINAANNPGSIRQGQPAWVEPGRTAVTTAGALGGGILGTPSGPLGTVGGAGLGGAGTGQAYDRMLELFGVKKPQTPMEAFKTAGTEFLGLATAEAGVQIGAKVIPPLVEGILAKMPWARKGATQVAQRLQQIAKEEGITLPGPAITGEHGQAAVYQTLGNYPTSIGPIEREVGNAFKQIEAMGGRKVAGKGLNVTPLQAGQTAQTGESLLYQRLNEQGKEIHNRFYELAKDTPIYLDKAKKTGEAILASDEFKILPKEVKDIVETIIERTTGARTKPQVLYKGKPTTTKSVDVTPDTLKKLGGQLPKETVVTQGSPFTNISSPTNIPGNIPLDIPRTLDQVDELRKLIQSNAGFEKVYPEKGDALIRRIGKALDDDILASTSKANPKAYDAFKEEKDFYSKNIFGKFKGRDIYKQQSMGETILKKDPSLVLQEANTVTGLKQLKEVMPENYYDVVRRGKIAESIEPALVEVDTIYGKAKIFDGDRLQKTIYQGMSPEYRASLFKTDELEAIDRLIQVSQSIKSMYKLGGSQSGTPKGMFFAKLLTGSAPTATAGYLVGGVPGIMIGTTLATAGPWGAAKFLTSEAGKRYMIEGIKLGAKTQTAIRGGAYTLQDVFKENNAMP